MQAHLIIRVVEVGLGQLEESYWICLGLTKVGPLKLNLLGLIELLTSVIHSALSKMQSVPRKLYDKTM